MRPARWLAGADEELPQPEERPMMALLVQISLASAREASARHVSAKTVVGVASSFLAATILRPSRTISRHLKSVW